MRRSELEWDGIGEAKWAGTEWAWVRWSGVSCDWGVTMRGNTVVPHI